MSPETTPLICLITGANRGIGYALAAQYLGRNNTIVVAAVRTPESASSLSLKGLPCGTGSSIIVIPYDSTSEKTIQTGIEILTREYGVHHLDIVIANAGITQDKRCSMLDADAAELEHLVRTNGLGPLFLFRQTLPLMRKSGLKPEAKFVNIGSATGSSTKADLVNMLQLAPMGASKAFGMLTTVFLSVEAPEILSFSICPGGVATDAFKQVHGDTEGTPLESVATPEEAAREVFELINSSRMETHQAGLFEAATKTRIPY